MSSGECGFRIPLAPITQPQDMLSVRRKTDQCTIITLYGESEPAPRAARGVVPSYIISWGGSQGRGGGQIEVDAIPGVLIALPCETLTISARFRKYPSEGALGVPPCTFGGVINYGAASPWRATHSLFDYVNAGAQTDWTKIPTWFRSWTAYVTGVLALELNMQPDQEAPNTLTQPIVRTSPLAPGLTPTSGKVNGATRYYRLANNTDDNAQAWMVFSTLD